jgi:peptidoglycan-associated lipoprotein
MKKQMGQYLIVVGLVVAMFAALGCQQQQVRPSKAEAVPELQRIHFDYDRSAIKSEYKSVLEGNAQWMRDHSDTTVAIEGHCDERGSTEYNIALGWRRARSAKNYMVSLGVSPSRLVTKSFGEERPLCRESNESCWWKNRRAEFLRQ